MDPEKSGCDEKYRTCPDPVRFNFPDREQVQKEQRRDLSQKVDGLRSSEPDPVYACHINLSDGN